jgi:hypothetical protein
MYRLHQTAFIRWRISAALAATALLGGAVPGARAQAPLSNADVVQMVKSGIADDAVLDSIDQHGSQFSNDPTSLIDMRNTGVSERVLTAMVRKGPAPDDPLDNQAVMRLARVGFSDDFLAVLLQQQPGKFDSSAGSIAALREAGVSDRIMSLMLPPGALPPPAGARTTAPAALSAAPSASAPSVSASGARANPPGAVATGRDLDQGPVREIPSGTQISVRIIDSIDSDRNREGDKFRATLDDPIRVGGDVLVTRGADARIRLIADQAAGKLSGRTTLTLRLEDVTVDGKTVPVNTSAVEEKSKSKTAGTATRAVAGGVLGGLIGALAGGGKGAAIGAGAGAAAGTGSEVFTKGPRVKVPSETILRFTTEGSIRLP